MQTIILEGGKIDSTCKQCGDNNDLMVIFTENKVCGKCTRKNHKNMLGDLPTEGVINKGDGDNELL